MAAPQHRPDPRRIPDVPDRATGPETLEELSLRIEMAELRVVRRDLEYRLHWDSLQQRGKAVLVPSRWLLPALGTGASWLFWRVVRGKKRRQARDHRDHERHDRQHFVDSAEPHRGHRAHEAAAGEGSARPEVGTLQLLTMLWGFMPARIRLQVGPEITQLLLGLVAGYMQGRKQQREDAAPSRNTDSR